MSRRLVLALLCGLAAAVGLAPATARADGDPGSDVLVYQNLFAPADANLSVAQQATLDRLLHAGAGLGAPVRVAIVAHPSDLGSVTQAFGRPVAYARFLGTELELEYPGRIVVVMPDGVGGFWAGHDGGSALGRGRGAGAAGLTAAAISGVERIEARSGISTARLIGAARAVGPAVPAGAGSAGASAAAPAVGTVPQAGAHATSLRAPIAILALLLVLGIAGLGLRRRGAGLLARTGIALPGLIIGVGALGVLAVLALVVHSPPANSERVALATNPSLGTLTPLTPRPAPDFTLTDETGRPERLSQYRGKVVILSFDDDECQTICPLTTQAMVDARDSLGAAADRVQLLGVNANPRSTQVDDVLNYTELHGLLGQWHFLTGPVARLERVWNAYGVGGDLSSASTLIDHTPLIWIIDPAGRVRETAFTYPSYASIPQFGQELARAAAQLLPEHPAVHTDYSYEPIHGIGPGQPIRLPRMGGGTVTLGRGGSHLYLFFATWDRQSTAIAAQMRALNGYAALARHDGLPPLTAIDEASVEPGRRALATFLAGLHLNYPVALDASGRVADGYGVQGEPWFILARPGAHDTPGDPTAQTPWQQEVYTQGWPSLGQLARTIPAALRPPPAGANGPAAVARELAGSPPALSALHAQAGRLLDGGPGGAALVSRLRALHGHPVVVNIWASTCPPCQQEFGWFAAESARYGKRVGFLGIDYDDASVPDAAGFLARHPVSYPSYVQSNGTVPASLLPGGVSGTPTTIFLGADGRVRYVQIGEYSSQEQLESQIGAYALGS